MILPLLHDYRDYLFGESRPDEQTKTRLGVGERPVLLSSPSNLSESHEMNTQNDRIAALVHRLNTTIEPLLRQSKPSARDWSAFFQALLELLTTILPVIIPYFTDQTGENPSS